MAYKLGIDLGGTKTEALLLGPDQKPLFRERVATPARDYDQILGMVEALVKRVAGKFPVDMTIGVGIPGAISPATGLLRNSNTVCMNGRPLLRDLETRLQRRLRIENDANCFALSEALGGAARGYGTVFGVIIGTGTGGGLVISGQLIDGPHSICGEWGHNPLPWVNAEDQISDCYCGRRGCIETFLSGPGLASGFAARFGRSLSSDEIVVAADNGDSECRIMLDSYHDQLARSLAHLINILDPQAIVLGGGMSNIDTIYREVPRLLPRYVFSDFVATPILKAERGDSSGVYGAAMLWD